MSVVSPKIPEAFEGTWEEVARDHASELSGQRVRVLLLADEPLTSPRQMLRRGMFAAHFPTLSLEDFKIAEFQGDEAA